MQLRGQVRGARYHVARCANSSLFVSCCTLMSAVVGGAGTAADPLGKTLELLTNLETRVVQDGKAEEKVYQEYVSFCKGTIVDKAHDIKLLHTEKEELEAYIAKASSDLGASTERIDELAFELASHEADLKAATEVRHSEAEAARSSEQRLLESIDALDRAAEILERGGAPDSPPATSLLQGSNVWSRVLGAVDVLVDAAGLTTQDVGRLSALLQEDDDDTGAPGAAAYDTSRSRSIVQVIEDIRDKAEVHLREVHAAEMSARHNFEMLSQALMAKKASADKEMQRQKSLQSQSKHVKAGKESDLSLTTTDLASAQAIYDDTQRSCMQHARDHEASITSRDEELHAISQAKELLMPAGPAAQRTYSFVQLGVTRRSLRLASRAASASRTSSGLALKGSRVVGMVRNLAAEQHSARLLQLASRLAAAARLGTLVGEDPFAKVKTLISDMVARLQQEGAVEAKEKVFCDQEIAKTFERKAELEYDSGKLKTRIDQAAAAAAKLHGEVAELQQELSTLATAQKDMDSLRSLGHKAYLEARADLQQGLDAVRSAMRLLSDFYRAEADTAAAALFQDGESLATDMSSVGPPGRHEKSTGAGTAIIKLLEVVESDLAKGLAETEAEEAGWQSEYEQTTQENRETKAVKEKDVLYKTKEFKGFERTINDWSSDRATVTDELAAVEEYYKKVQDRCVAKPEVYEQRRSRRQAEIDGLREALGVLESENTFLQRRRS